MPAKTTFQFLILLSLDVTSLHATLSLLLTPFLLPFLLLTRPDVVLLLVVLSFELFWVQPRRQKPLAVTPRPGATLSVVGSYFFLCDSLFRENSEHWPHFIETRITQPKYTSGPRIVGGLRSQYYIKVCRKSCKIRNGNRVLSSPLDVRLLE